ncbi:PQQ-binding-like beta-propeller repeat protein [Chitinophaga agrisoli]|uniref:PQQ-binding-like beta-propeller repeat protein n=1 Tax=Chitinophaga agrisoli TaxID=2607653 RepID=A0A5B2VVX7_9BACT|nr:PQQ-binding-like beta-propeller repeat protein [Chitinophaga agrisoli]KAA2242738.1 PQQ-binding-like beta-propeller repeat protein [Chitinophaga agrisoli]
MMLRLKETWTGYYAVFAQTAACLYVYHNHTIIEIDRQNSSSRTIVAGVTKYHIRALALNGGVVLGYNSRAVYFSPDGSALELGEQLYPEWRYDHDIIVTNKTQEPYTLERRTPEGGAVWAKELKLANQQYVHDDVLYFKRKDGAITRPSILNKLLLRNGEYQELTDFGGDTGYHILTFHNNTLVCLLDNGIITGVDPDSGDIKWTVEGWVDNEGQPQPGYLHGPLQGGVYQDKIYSLLGPNLASFDLETRSCRLLKKIEKDPQGETVFVKRGALYGHHIYYTADNGARQWNRFGVFDVHQQEILWQTQLSLPKGAMLNTEPIISAHYVFVNDSAFNLYIFEKV